MEFITSYSLYWTRGPLWKTSESRDSTVIPFHWKYWLTSGIPQFSTAPNLEVVLARSPIRHASTERLTSYSSHSSLTPRHTNTSWGLEPLLSRNEGGSKRNKREERRKGGDADALTFPMGKIRWNGCRIHEMILSLTFTNYKIMWFHWGKKIIVAKCKQQSLDYYNQQCD